MNIPGKADYSEWFSMVWRAGFQSGLRISKEGYEDGVIRTPEEFRKRTDELLNADADSVVTLLNLRREMMGPQK